MTAEGTLIMGIMFSVRILFPVLVLFSIGYVYEHRLEFARVVATLLGKL